MRCGGCVCEGVSVRCGGHISEEEKIVGKWILGNH